MATAYEDGSVVFIDEKEISTVSESFALLSRLHLNMRHQDYIYWSDSILWKLVHWLHLYYWRWYCVHASASMGYRRSRRSSSRERIQASKVEEGMNDTYSISNTILLEKGCMCECMVEFVVMMAKRTAWLLLWEASPISTSSRSTLWRLCWHTLRLVPIMAYKMTAWIAASPLVYHTKEAACNSSSPHVMVHSKQASMSRLLPIVISHHPLNMLCILAFNDDYVLIHIKPITELCL